MNHSVYVNIQLCAFSETVYNMRSEHINQCTIIIYNILCWYTAVCTLLYIWYVLDPYIDQSAAALIRRARNMRICNLYLCNMYTYIYRTGDILLYITRLVILCGRPAAAD